MNETRTGRLNIIHLSLEDMARKIENGDEFAKQFYQAALADMKNLQWYTLWSFALISDGKTIGGACFKGGPNINGEVEIGYGIEETYQNKGYATEATGVLVNWALNQPGVLAVIAETNKENAPSQRVLEKVGMFKYRETKKRCWWRIEKQS